MEDIMKNNKKLILIILAFITITGSLNHLTAMQSDQNPSISIPGVRIVEDIIDDRDEQLNSNSSDEETDDEVYAKRHKKLEALEKKRVTEVIVNRAQCTVCDTWHTIPDFIDIRAIEKNDRWTCNNVTWTSIESPCAVQQRVNHKSKSKKLPIKKKCVSKRRKKVNNPPAKRSVECSFCARRHQIPQDFIEAGIICPKTFLQSNWMCKDACWLDRPNDCTVFK